MFKKIYKEIEKIYDKISNLSMYIESRGEYNATYIQTIDTKLNNMSKLESLENTIESQQRTIEQLTNALKDKYEHGLFIVSNDGKIPMVIRDGIELTNQLTTEFTISWTPGEVPYISIEQLAGTYNDMD